MPKDSEIQNRLNVSIGQYSSKGVKEENQDFHGAMLPDGGERTLKGITLAIADGISSSSLSSEASETVVKALMTDYYCTSDAWTVKTAASKVIAATNSWLYGENRRARISDMNHGRVCTLSALILKGHSAHIFHIGDSRIWRLSGAKLEPLTQDHTVVLSNEESYLGRSVGSSAQVEIDYSEFKLNVGDIYILTTDGIHEHWNASNVIETLQNSLDLDSSAEQIARHALENGSTDNLTLQIVRIDSLPNADDNCALIDDTLSLPITTLPNAGDIIDGFTIVRPIVSSARSHIYLATAPDNSKVVLKFPSVDMQDNLDYLRRFIMEEWIARRINSPHVLGPAPAPEKRTALYTVTEFVEGETLRQWMIDNPTPSLVDVRSIIEQIVAGLRAFHRKEMLHQDLRPENIMIDNQGTVKIIDFGSTRVAGVQEISPAFEDDDILGTHQYSAPEYFLGYGGTEASDLFSLGVIAYEILRRELPYGAKVSRARTRKDLARLTFKSTLSSKEPLPDWVEFALSKAVHLDAARRYQVFSEFLSDMRRPSPDFKSNIDGPLLEKNPVLFWKGVSLFFAATSLLLLISKF